MKPYTVLIAILFLRSAAIVAQFQNTVADSGVSVQILLQESNIPIIDGSKTGSGESLFYVNTEMQIPSKESVNADFVFVEKKRNVLKSEAVRNPEESFYSFVEKNLYLPGDDTSSFRVTGIHTDNLGITHIRSVQRFHGIEVYGSESVYHLDADKERLTGNIHRLPPELPVLPVINREQAIDIVEGHLKDLGRFRELTAAEKKFLDYDMPTAELNYFRLEKGEYKLSWNITLRPNFIEEWKYFIDAMDGSVILNYNNTKADGPAKGTGSDLNYITRTFNVYEAAGIYYLYDVSQKMFNPSTNEGIIITLDGNSTSTLNLDYTYVTSADNSWSQKAAISAHCNASRTYQYFDTTFNRNSINGKGGNIISIINITNDDGTEIENAFWNGQAVFYGNGGDRFKPLAGALDVTAHELSHGVIASSANLVYYGQAGAINEAYADIFACMIDRNDWTIGEDITLEGFSPSGVIRDLADPHNKGTISDYFWQPIHTTEMYLGPDDNGGIHVNSGIINHAFYNYAINIGKNKAEQVFYRALTEYLTMTSGFIELRIAVVQSARDLYGDQSVEMYEAARVFELAGIYEEEYIDKTPSYPVNTGDQLLLSYDTSPTDPVSLYVSSSQGTNYRPVTNTPMNGKVSVTDDGNTGVFVSSERRIRMINTGIGEIDERIISGFNYYDNVAISRDGKRIAATRGIYDGSIYVFDLVSSTARQFKLYNPTTNLETIDAGGVVKAYSVEFDNTGEYLIYDAYNVINSNTTKDIYYWDIGFIRVWNTDSADFGDGRITQLYTALPMNVNVANPVFAKNSPHIIAFDYFYDDGIIEKYSVYTADLITGKTSLIAVNDRLGYPSFSTDDKRLAYSGINSSNMQVINSIRLAADKLTPVGEAGVLVPDAKWPVYFTRGIRVLGLAPIADFTTDFKYGNYPVTSRFLDISANEPVSWHWIFEGGNPSESFEQNPVVVFDIPGFYRVTLITSNAFGSDTLVRDRYIHAINPTPVTSITEKLPRIYPNPVTDDLKVTIEGNFEIKIFNLQGDLLYFSRNTHVIGVSDLSSGIYVAEITTSDSSYRIKFVKL